MSDEFKDCRILSIDAWRHDGSWQWNNWFDTGKRFALAEQTNRQILKWFRDEGILSAHSAGRVAIEDDGYNLVVLAKGTREPLFAIEYGADE